MPEPNIQSPALALLFNRDGQHRSPAATQSGSARSAINSAPTTSVAAVFNDLDKRMSKSRLDVRGGLLQALASQAPSTSSTSTDHVVRFLAACRTLPDLLGRHTTVTEQVCQELHDKDPSVYPIMSPEVVGRILSTRSSAWLKRVSERTDTFDGSAAQTVFDYLKDFADGPTVDVVLKDEGTLETFRLPLLTLTWDIAEAIVEPNKRELPLADAIRSAAASLDDSGRALAEAEDVAKRVGAAPCRHAGLIDVCDKFFRPIGLVGTWTIDSQNHFTYEVIVSDRPNLKHVVIDTLLLTVFDNGFLNRKPRKDPSMRDSDALQARYPYCPITYYRSGLHMCHLLPAREGAEVFENLVRLGRHYERQHHRPLPGAPTPWYDLGHQQEISGQWNIIRMFGALNTPEDWVFVLKWPSTHCPPDALPTHIVRFFTIIDEVVWDGLSEPRTARVVGADRDGTQPSLTFWNLSGRFHGVAPNVTKHSDSGTKPASTVACATGMTGLDAKFSPPGSPPGSSVPYLVEDPGFPPPFIWDLVEAQRFVTYYGTSAVSAIQHVAEKKLKQHLLAIMGMSIPNDNRPSPGTRRGSSGSAGRNRPPSRGQDRGSGRSRGRGRSRSAQAPDVAEDTGPDLRADGTTEEDGVLSAYTYACIYLVLRLVFAVPSNANIFDDDSASDGSQAIDDIEMTPAPIASANCNPAEDPFRAQHHSRGWDSIPDWQSQVLQENESAPLVPGFAGPDPSLVFQSSSAPTQVRSVDGSNRLAEHQQDAGLTTLGSSDSHRTGPATPPQDSTHPGNPVTSGDKSDRLSGPDPSIVL